MTIERIAERDGWSCWLCGGALDGDGPLNGPAAPTIDHVVPRSRGGRSDLSNLRLAHRRCNGRRGNHLPELDWPTDLALLDAPNLWQSLRRIVNRVDRPSASPELVALAADRDSAVRAAEWVTATAERFLGGRWEAVVEPVGAGEAHRVRLSVAGPVADPGKPFVR